MKLKRHISEKDDAAAAWKCYTQVLSTIINEPCHHIDASTTEEISPVNSEDEQVHWENAGERPINAQDDPQMSKTGL